MPAIVLDVLKYLFILLIFLFLARAVRAMLMEIAGPRTARAQTNRPAGVKARPGKPPERVTLIQPDGKSKTFDIGDELMIGRDAKCQVILEDTYASQIHARVFTKDDGVFIEDMGSTNGTYLNRKKVTSALSVARGDRVRIGKTELEFKR